MEKEIIINIESQDSINQLLDNIKYNDRGLIPAILQEAGTNEVLMMAYMNPESLKLTIMEKRAWFWSRSRQKLWLKGETSGNYQIVKEIRLDCDRDTLLLKVAPAGPACHTGRKSCFFYRVQNNNTDNIDQKRDPYFIYRLYNIISNRKKENPEDSYTSSLMKKGIDRIGKKVGEEATEVVIAGKNNDQAEIIEETADLIYHLLVLLAYFDITLTDINNKLEKRHNKT